VRRHDDAAVRLGRIYGGYTIKLIAPAVGDKIVARGRVVRSGRTLSVAAADVYAVREGKETLCATALATIRNFEISG
jgi:acyl-coenzyme A thioesterase PaaI-like protein